MVLHEDYKVAFMTDGWSATLLGACHWLVFAVAVYINPGRMRTGHQHSASAINGMQRWVCNQCACRRKHGKDLCATEHNSCNDHRSYNRTILHYNIVHHLHVDRPSTYVDVLHGFMATICMATMTTIKVDKPSVKCLVSRATEVNTFDLQQQTVELNMKQMPDYCKCAQRRRSVGQRGADTDIKWKILWTWIEVLLWSPHNSQHQQHQQQQQHQHTTSTDEVRWSIFTCTTC